MSPPAPWDLPKVTIEAYDLPVTDVLLDVASQASVSVVPPDSKDLELLTLSLVDVPAEQAFRTIGDRIGMIPTLEAGIVTYSESGRSSFRFLDPGYEDPKVLQDVVRGLLGNSATVKEVGQRLAVVSSDAGIERAAELERQVRTGADGWELSVVVFAVTRGLMREAGIGVTGAGRGSAALTLDANGLGGSSPLQASVTASLAALWSAAETEREAVVLTHASLYVLEGESARCQQGEVVPVARRTISDQGTVTVTGFDYVESGFTMSASARRVPAGVLLRLQPTLSEITGYVDGNPIRAERSVEAVAVMDSGHWIILSGFDVSAASLDRSGWPGVRALQSTERSSSTLSVVIAVRAVRVFASGGAS